MKHTKAAKEVAPRLIGKTEADALKAIKAYNLKYRYVSENGVHRIVTRDVMPDRVNLVLLNGVVTEATVG